MSAIDLHFSLADVYSRESGQLYMNGIQALVRLPMMQRRFDKARGLSTAGLISGYRGSPLGAYDQQLWRAEKQLAANDIVFQPGLNEDLGATALWGAQMHSAFGPTKVDGVFGIWYGKGPGVDRCGDVFRHANMFGTSRLGGVIALAGDDHAAQSSIFPHQTDGIFQSVMMPILQPSSVEEILTLGMAAFELSRFSGVWITMKTIAEVVESAASFPAPNPSPVFVTPSDMIIPERGFGWDPALPWPASRVELERRMLEERLPAAQAWVRANNLDRIVQDAPNRRRVLITVGKAHQDLMEALNRLGITPERAADMGIVIYKVAMSWPLETKALRSLAVQAELMMVFEEKKGFVEDQLKAALYSLPGGGPRVIGKHDEHGASLLPEVMELSPLLAARALLRGLRDDAAPFQNTMGDWEARAERADRDGLVARRPFFCAGCPHNTSTRTPDGSISGGGIGCHAMAVAEPALKTATFSHMGAEGIQWVGAAPFVETAHMFQNLGDGTYQHSGILAVRAAIAAKSNITFKVLYNDAVAMTGGQTPEGSLDPLSIARQLTAEGVSRLALVSDDPDRWRGAKGLPPETEVLHRDELDALQRRFREIPGVTAIVYEQTCASEKRRRRKRGAFPDPDKRLLINPRVCEGCGDCSVQSNCIAVEPLETELGVKRRINQHVCNKDFSCVKGFCPSFVEIAGAKLRKADPSRLATASEALFAALPAPVTPVIAGDFNVFIAGVGGTGVLTLGALLGTAAHVEGLASTTLDFTGLAQKNGAVTSQVRMAASRDLLHAVRVTEGAVDLMLAADMVAGSSAEALLALSAERSRVALNDDSPPTADAVVKLDVSIPTSRTRRAIGAKARGLESVHATRLAEALFGDPSTANTLLLGFAWQKGWLPLSDTAILRAIEINGVAVEANKSAFRWGRAAAHNLAQVEALVGLRTGLMAEEATDALIARLSADLVAYQGRSYAARFEQMMAKVRAADAAAGPDDDLSRAVARQTYRLMAYKDEYEVARLYSEPQFKVLLESEFAIRGKTSVWLAPPLLSRTDPATGRPKKRKFGPWIWPLMRVLAKAKFLRGGMFDPFGYSAERRGERALLHAYAEDIGKLITELKPETYDRAVALAGWPAAARGFGPVKEAGMKQAWAARQALWAAFHAPAQMAA